MMNLLMWTQLFNNKANVTHNIMTTLITGIMERLLVCHQTHIMFNDSNTNQELKAAPERGIWDGTFSSFLCFENCAAVFNILQLNSLKFDLNFERLHSWDFSSSKSKMSLQCCSRWYNIIYPIYFKLVLTISEAH